MKKKRFSVEQMIGVLKQSQVGVPVAEVIRKAGISCLTETIDSEDSPSVTCPKESLNASKETMSAHTGEERGPPTHCLESAARPVPSELLMRAVLLSEHRSTPVVLYVLAYP
jgi:hypothetical protein